MGLIHIGVILGEAGLALGTKGGIEGSGNLLKGFTGCLKDLKV